MSKRLVISTPQELVRIAPENVVYFSSDGNYTTMFQSDGENKVFTIQLGKIGEMINEQFSAGESTFVRIGRSLIINWSYVYLVNVPKQRLILSDIRSFKYELHASYDELKGLKEGLEKMTR